MANPASCAFFCNWCTYTAADLAGVSRLKYAANIRVIRLMCSGRVDPQFILDALARGADGVLIGGCHPGDCHYVEGNYKMLRRFQMLKRMLKDLGIEEQRVRLEWISAAEGEKVKRVVNEMVGQVQKLGPLGMPAEVRGVGQGNGTFRRASGGERRRVRLRLRRRKTSPLSQPPKHMKPTPLVPSPAPASGSDMRCAVRPEHSALTRLPRLFRLSDFRFRICFGFRVSDFGFHLPAAPEPASTLNFMSASSKPKVAFYWCASCGGCEETVVDLAEDILGVVAAVDIVLWPVAMDFKYKSIEAMPDKSITATLLNGAIRSTEQEEMARLMRRKSQFLIAYGSCAVSGGIPGLANQFPREQILKFNYEDAPTLGNGGPKTRPQLKFAEAGREVSLPELHNVVRSLDQVVDVDYYVPGCPHAQPHQGRHHRAPRRQAAAQRLGPGARHRPVRRVLAQEVQAHNLSITEFKRPHQCGGPRALLPGARRRLHGAGDPQRLRLPVHTGNMPCTGCFGPTSRCATRASRSCPPSAPISRRRKKATSTSAGGHPGPHRHLLPLRPRQEHAAAEGESGHTERLIAL